MRDYSYGQAAAAITTHEVWAGRGDGDLRCQRRPRLSIIPAEQITRRGFVRIGFTNHFPAYSLLTLNFA